MALVRLYLDTNVLPVRGPFRSGVVAVILQLARRSGAVVVLPQLVVDEYVQLRSREAAEAIKRMEAAFRQAHRVLNLAPIYIPSVDEVVEPVITEMRQSVSIVTVHPDDACEALRREACRIPPARDGRGSRDTAIWLTAIRDCRASDDDGVFFTNNHRDFAPSGTLSEELISDLGSHAARLQYEPDAFAWVSRQAPKLAAIPDEARRLLSDLTAMSEFPDRLLGLISDRHDNEVTVLPSPKVVSAHEIEGVIVMKVDVGATVDGQEYRVLVWLDYDGELLEFGAIDEVHQQT